MRRRIAARSATSRRPAIAPCGTGRRASTASPSSAAAKRRRCASVGLPGDPDDSHSRYIEAEVDGVIVASIYLPNGNPIGTEKFAYKLRWMERLARARRRTAGRGAAGRCWPATTMSFPRTATPSRAGRWPMTRCSSPKARPRSARSSTRAGPTRCARSTRTSRGSTPSGIIRPAPGSATRASASTICLLSPQAADRLRGAGVDKWARGEEKASDHAPTWVELGLEAPSR